MKRKILSLAMALAMALTLFPGAAFAAEAETPLGISDTGLCAHHPTHNEGCGYREAVQGAGCAHEHTENCYIGNGGKPTCGLIETEDEAAADSDTAHKHTQACYPPDCPHTHDEGCGYVKTTAEIPCAYACEICNANNNGDNTPCDLTESCLLPRGHEGVCVPPMISFATPMATDIEINAVNFPDVNFRDWLRTQSYGTDGTLSPMEINNITRLDINGRGISNLKGIEYFTALEILSCSNNRLTSLGALPISLTTLYCSGNKLTSLRSLPAGLTALSCSNNRITDLDVSGLPLVYLNCSMNYIKSDAIKGFTGSWDNRSFIFSPQNYVPIDAATFPDANFRSWLLRQPYVADGVIFFENIYDITAMDISGQNISDLTGITNFSYLTDLDCSSNVLTKIGELPYALTALNCSNNRITDLEFLPYALTALNCSNNRLANLDVKGLKLRSLDCSRNYLPSTAAVKGFTGSWDNRAFVFSPQDYIPIDAATFPDANFRNWLLTQPYGTDNALSPTDIEGITTLNVSGKTIESLRGIEYFTALKNLDCSNNQLTALDVTGLALTDLNCSRNYLPSPAAVKGFTGTWDGSRFVFSPQKDIPIDAATFPDANFRDWLRTQPYGTDNTLSPSDIEGITALNVSGKTIESLRGIEYFTALKNLDCSNNQLTALDVTGLALTDLNCSRNYLPSPAAVKGFTGTWDDSRFVFSPQKDIPINATTFPDQNFRDYLRTVIIAGRDDVLTYTERQFITSINLDSLNISSLKGIEYLIGLKGLSCSNNNLTKLEALPDSLIVLHCDMNRLTDLGTLPDRLTELICNYNRLTDLGQLPSGLTSLQCNNNRLSDLGQLPDGLVMLDCMNNRLTDLGPLPTGLTDLTCAGNLLTDLGSLPTGLISLRCDDNQLTDLGSLPTGLIFLSCNGNRLTDLGQLPRKLSILQCMDNLLTDLGPLPTGLNLLNCAGNLLTDLGQLPTGLTMLYCINNLLTDLGPLPTGLTDLNCADNLLTGLDVEGLNRLSTLVCKMNYMPSPAAVKGFTGTWDNTDFVFAPQRSVPAYSISAAPANLAFGSKPAGYIAPDAQTVTITNTGNRSITLTQPTATSYDIGSLSQTILAANGDTATFTVQPKTGLAVGTYHETITVSGTDHTSASVALSFAVNPKGTKAIGLIDPPDENTPIDTTKDLRIGFDGEYWDIASIRLNGIELTRTHTSETSCDLSGFTGYNGVLGKAERGSVYVTLYKEFLQTLPSGKYILEVDFEDDTTIAVGSAPFTIEKNSPTQKPDPNSGDTPASQNSPQTGDNSNAGLWLTLSLLSLAGISIPAWRLRKKPKKSQE